MKMTEEQKKVRDLKKAEDNEKNVLLSRLKDVKESFLNEPTYFFNVGDRVQRGHVEESYIEEVLDNGKIYKLKEKYYPRQNAPLKERYDYVAWINIRPYVEKCPPISEAFCSKLNLYRQISYSQRVIGSLLSMYYGSYAGIDDKPDYQRDLVWDLSDKISLIDSIFKNIDIGKFTLIKRPFDVNDKGYEILDGKQRLNTIIEFYEDRFTYRGLKFSELHVRDQWYFENFNVNVGITDPMTNKEKYEYFLRLNVGGRSQDPSHIKKVEELLTKEI